MPSRRSVWIPAIGAVAFILAGCSLVPAKSPLVGTWTNRDNWMEFRADGTFEFRDMDSRWAGTYEVVADRAVLTYTEVFGRPAPPGETIIWRREGNKLFIRGSGYSLELSSAAGSG